MALTLPPDESFGLVSWLSNSGLLTASHEWRYLAISPFTGASGTFPSFNTSGYLSTNMPGFEAGNACLPNLTGASVGTNELRSFGATWASSIVDTQLRSVFVRRCVDGTLGSTVAGGFRGCLLYQRIGGAFAQAVNAGTPTATYAKLLSCYTLWIEPSSTLPDADLTIRLIRVIGSVTTVALYPMATHTIPNGLSNINLETGIEVSLAVANVGGDPVLTAKVHNYNLAGRLSTVTLFDATELGGTVVDEGADFAITSGAVTDSGSLKIAGAGGFGFGLPGAREDTVGLAPVDITEGITLLRLTNTASGVVLYNDTFSRTVGIDDGEALLTNVFHRAISIHGDEGAWAQSGWSFGSCAAVDNTAADVDPLLGRSIVGSTANDPVAYARPRTSLVAPSSGQLINRDYFSTRPADYNYSQHRSLEFKPFDHKVNEPNWITCQDFYGISLFAIVGGGFIVAAYAVFLTPTFEESGGSLSQIALTVSLSVRTKSALEVPDIWSILWTKTIVGVDLTDGGWHTLDYDIHVLEGATDQTAPLVHTVKLDGAVVVFDTVGPWGAGLQVLADGRVIDNSPYSIHRGDVEAFWVGSTNPETDISSNSLRGPAQVRNWTQGTLTVLDSTLAPDDMASFAWESDEGAADVTGDLSTVFDAVFPFRERYVGTAPIELGTETGLRLTRARATRTRRHWTLVGAPLSSADKDTLESFWASHGVKVPFNWTPDGEAAVIAYFVEAPAYKMVGVQAWIPSIEIEELIP